MDFKNQLKKADIMIIDDEPNNLRVLIEMLRKRGYEARPVPSGSLALEAIKVTPPDLILLDIIMPDLDGYEVCKMLKADPQYNEIPVIFLSCKTDESDIVKAFSVGGIDYITKPFHMEEVYARVETQLKLHFLTKDLKSMVERKTLEIESSNMATIFAMSKLVESRDKHTGMHLEKVREHICILTDKLRDDSKYSDIITDEFEKHMYNGSILHDIGKVGIPDAILLKPGVFTEQEFEIMKTHTTIGGDTLKGVYKYYPNNKFVEMGINIAMYHHEKWNGKGYPEGLSGEDISLEARIMAIIDVYEALRSDRPYKDAFSHEKSMEIISKESGEHFDPEIVRCFVEISDEVDEIWSQNISCKMEKAKK